jgi:hypothetical protein
LIADLVQLDVGLTIGSVQEFGEVLRSTLLSAFEADPDALHIIELEGLRSSAEGALCLMLLYSFVDDVQVVVHEACVLVLL